MERQKYLQHIFNVYSRLILYRFIHHLTSRQLSVTLLQRYNVSRAN
jgi:hypothetical protein